jgi:hypothetical protein
MECKVIVLVSFFLIFFANSIRGQAGLYYPPARGPQQCGPTATYSDCNLITPPCGGQVSIGTVWNIQKDTSGNITVIVWQYQAGIGTQYQFALGTNDSVLQPVTGLINDPNIASNISLNFTFNVANFVGQYVLQMHFTDQPGGYSDCYSCSDINLINPPPPPPPPQTPTTPVAPTTSPIAVPTSPTASSPQMSTTSPSSPPAPIASPATVPTSTGAPFSYQSPVTPTKSTSGAQILLVTGTLLFGTLLLLLL